MFSRGVSLQDVTYQHLGMDLGGDFHQEWQETVSERMASLADGGRLES